MDIFRALHLAVVKGVWPLPVIEIACWAPSLASAADYQPRIDITSLVSYQTLPE